VIWFWSEFELWVSSEKHCNGYVSDFFTAKGYAAYASIADGSTPKWSASVSLKTFFLFFRFNPMLKLSFRLG
jgi:hypothetical protein